MMSPGLVASGEPVPHRRWDILPAPSCAQPGAAWPPGRCPGSPWHPAAGDTAQAKRHWAKGQNAPKMSSGGNRDGREPPRDRARDERASRKRREGQWGQGDMGTDRGARVEGTLMALSPPLMSLQQGLAGPGSGHPFCEGWRCPCTPHLPVSPCPCVPTSPSLCPRAPCPHVSLSPVPVPVSPPRCPHAP